MPFLRGGRSLFLFLVNTIVFVIIGLSLHLAVNYAFLSPRAKAVCARLGYEFSGVGEICERVGGVTTRRACNTYHDIALCKDEKGENKEFVIDSAISWVDGLHEMSEAMIFILAFIGICASTFFIIKKKPSFFIKV